MKKIQITTNRPYSILIEEGLINKAPFLIKEEIKGGRLCLVSDENVFNVHGKRLVEILKKAGHSLAIFTFPEGETSKNMEVYARLLEFLAENNFTRKDGLVALGGGVTGDLTGFAAATYLRGVSYIQIPTTLLSAVDSSVGGKTGINLAQGKNLAGVFWQPSLVICDPNLLKTMPLDQWRNGMGEVLKYALLQGGDIFNLIKSLDSLEQLKDTSETATTHREKTENTVLEDIIYQSLLIKAYYVTNDEREAGLRQFLNLGHTLGHSLEKLSNYKVFHGEAVAFGILKAAKIAEKLFGEQQNSQLSGELNNIYKKLNFTTTYPYSSRELAKGAMSDKKKLGDQLTLILPLDFGNCIRHTIKASQLEDLVG